MAQDEEFSTETRPGLPVSLSFSSPRWRGAGVNREDCCQALGTMSSCITVLLGEAGGPFLPWQEELRSKPEGVQLEKRAGEPGVQTVHGARPGRAFGQGGNSMEIEA